MSRSAVRHNVCNWDKAVNESFNPTLYTYNGDLIQQGKMTVTLDYKIWAKKIMAINCYFTEIESQKKIQVTIYCNKKTGSYKAPESEIDFSICRIECLYEIILATTINRRIILLGACQI